MTIPEIIFWYFLSQAVALIWMRLRKAAQERAS